MASEAEAIIALFQYLDEKKSGVANAAVPHLTAGRYSEALKIATENLSLIFAEPEKEAEEALYIVAALVEKALNEKANDKDKTQTTKLVEQLAHAITASTEPHTNLRLKNLSSIFNLIHPKHPARFVVFSSLIAFASQTNNIELIVLLLDKLDLYLAEWGTDAEGRRAILLAVVDALSKSKKRQALAHEYLIKYLEQFQGASPADLTSVETHAVKAVVAALSVPDSFQFERYLDLDAVKHLAKTNNAKLFDLLVIFASKSLPEFLDFDKANAAVLSSHQLDRDALTLKMRLLSLCTLAASSSSLSFADIAKALQVSESDVEAWVIRGISAKLIDARINQPTKTVAINSTSVRMFSEAQWGQLHAKLSSWRDGVESLVQIVRKSRGEE